MKNRRRVGSRPLVSIIQEYIPAYRTAFFEQLQCRLDERGIDLRVYAGEPGHVQKMRGDHASFTGLNTISHREFSVRGKRVVISNVWFRTIADDLVIYEQARRNFSAYMSLAIRRLCFKKTALWGHGRDYSKASGGPSTALLKIVTRLANFFFVYTDGGRVALLDQKIEDDRIFTVCNSIDTVSMRRGLTRVAEEAGVGARPTGRLRLVYIGGLDESKRISFLLESLRILDKYRDFEIVFVGDGPLRGEVDAFCKTNINASAIGYASGSQKYMALICADLIVNPGRVGLIALDSLVSGVPIVTTEYELHAPEFEYLSPGETCVQTADNVEAYAASIGDMDSHSIALMRSSCINAGNAYSIENMVERFARGIESALAAS